jgi:hypothetical protein
MSIAVYVIGALLGAGFGIGLGFMNRRSQEECDSPT